MTRKRKGVERPSCSFCARDHIDVRWLIASPTTYRRVPTAYICDVCILLAVHALADKLASQP